MMDADLALAKRIQSYNELNLKKCETEIYALDKGNLPMDGEEIKKKLCRYKYSEEKMVDDYEREITPQYKTALVEKLNLEHLPGKVIPECALCVQNTNLRLYPTVYGCYKEKKKAIDYFAVSLVKIGERVLCWHKDTSGKWYFIQTKNAWGWVGAHTLAFITADSWQKIKNQEFIQVLAPQMRLKDNNALLFYGTRLPFLGVYAKQYLAMLPRRNKWGEAYFEKILLPLDGPLSVGVLVFTPQQIVLEGCKFLQEKYDWGGKHGGHDCTSLLGDIFRACGVNLASNSYKMLLMSGVEPWEENWGTQRRLAKLGEINCGSILLFKGHGMLYLGRRGDKESILHSVYRLGQDVGGKFLGYNINKTTVGDLSQRRECAKSLLASIEGSLDLFSFIDGLIS